MGRIIGFLFGLVAYLVFLPTFLYAIGFVTGVGVPKTIDDGPVVRSTDAGTNSVNQPLTGLLSMLLCSTANSALARKPFKRWFNQFVPASVERSIYVPLASL